MDETPPPPSPTPAPPPLQEAPPARAEAKATLLLLLLLALVAGSIVFVLYARGAFEPTQQLVLIAEDSEGVVVGMDLTFSGFAIGRVRRIELAPDGNARIVIDVPRKDAHWLRTSSVFTLVRGLVGNTSIRAYSGILTDPPLPAGAERKVLAGDASAEIPQLMSSAKELLQNLSRLTATDSALAGSLAQVQTLTEKLNGPQGALGVLMGNEADAKKVLGLVERSQALVARLDGLAQRLDGVAARADQQVFGADGVMRDAQATVRELNTLLAETRGSLKKVDAMLADAQVIASNARVASTDLGQLRAEVEASLRKVEQLVNDINRRWPFARDTELKLP
ncbi:MlaD family protein [Aquabacterium sp.]|uniref:MlaD family protein n=1 Tax=Aquabacterium sp. TaxID=1872578 RepID=UPI00378444ED